MPRTYKPRPLPHEKPGPKTIKGNTKKCNCAVHRGEYIPLDQFWVHKRGRMKGKPMSRCIDALRRQQGRKPGVSGYVPLSRFKFVFRELESRIGRVETCRRAKISINFWHRMDTGYAKQARKSTIIKLIAVLRDCREKDEVRHKDSIRHGAAKRGRKEREIVTAKDYNIAHGDADNERKRNYTSTHPNYNKRQSQKRAENKRLTNAK